MDLAPLLDSDSDEAKQLAHAKIPRMVQKKTLLYVITVVTGVTVVTVVVSVFVFNLLLGLL